MRELNGAWNFRDVTDVIGDVLRPGKFFRSSELTQLNDHGRSMLRELGITDIADLRSPHEVERRGPGRVPADVAVHLLPFPDIEADAEGESPHEHAFNRMMTEAPNDESLTATASRYMVEEYRRFAGQKGAQRAVRQLISLLAVGRPVVAHCFAGKDRTGFTVAVVLEALGVDQGAIMADYLHSNEALPQLRARILDMVDKHADPTSSNEAVTFAEARLTDAVLGVREEYLVAARAEIDRVYGSLATYLSTAGISAADVDQLRAALLK